MQQGKGFFSYSVYRLYIDLENQVNYLSYMVNIKRLFYFNKYILQTNEDIRVEDINNIQKLQTSNTAADPLTIAIISAVAGAIASETFKWSLSKIPTFNIQWKNKRAERLLIAVSVIQAGKLILMTKRKKKENSNLTWCFPAARVRNNQIIIERLKTRYKEKFNLEVKPTKQIGETYIPREDLKILYFHCEYDKGTITNLDEEENDEVKWVDVNEVENLVTTRIDPSVVKLVSKIKMS